MASETKQGISDEKSPLFVPDAVYQVKYLLILEIGKFTETSVMSIKYHFRKQPLEFSWII